MDLTLFEVHLEEGTFTANAPFSGDRPDNGEASDDSETSEDSGEGDGSGSRGGRGKLSVLLALLILAGLAAAAYRLVGDEPEVDVDVS